MAGGIDWFRWHHGSVSDLKFPLVAKRSGASVAEVIAVWACLLEAASMNADQRGVLSGLPDFDALDCALGMSDGRCEAIFRALQARGLIDEHLHIVAWSKRQPKREREDDNSTSRVQAFRERKRHGTPCNASDGTETPRGEESREEAPPTETASPSVVSASKSPRPSRKCPATFVVTDELRQWAAQEFPGLNVDAETATFRDHTFATARTDWAGTWRNWMRKASGFIRASPQSRGGNPPDLEARNREIAQRWAMQHDDGVIDAAA